MSHLNYKTICLAAGLTAFFLAAPIQTAHAREQTSFGFYFGISDYDFHPGNRWHRDYYHNDHRHYYPPYRRDYYGPGRNYPYRQHYYRNDDSDRVIAAAAGIFFGALIISELVRYMNDVDLLRARQANMAALTAPIGANISWNNSQSDNYGTVTATRDGYSDSGKYCREFYQTVSIGGRTENSYGVACRQPDGSWNMVPQR